MHVRFALVLFATANCVVADSGHSCTDDEAAMLQMKVAPQDKSSNEHGNEVGDLIEKDDAVGELLEKDDQVKSNLGLLPHEMKESAKRWMQYGWAPDSDSPNFVKHKVRLFDLEWDDDIEATALAVSSTHMTNRESLSATASAISADMSLQASYGAFSGALAASVNRGSSHTHRQMVTIRQTRSSMARVINNLGVTSLSQRVTSEAVTEINSATPEQIVDFLGEFWVREMTLGGVIETRFQQTQTDSDSYSDFTASVEAAVNSLVEITGSASTSIESSATHSNMDLHVTTTVQGGDTAHLLGALTDDKQDAWAESLQGRENLYPIAFTFRPIWEIVKRVNSDKGQQVQSWLEARWRGEHLQLEGYDGLPLADASSRPVQPEGIYRIQQKETSRFLDAFTAANDYQAVTNEHQNNPSQFWYLQSVDDQELYTIRQVGDNEARTVLRYLDAHQQSHYDYGVVTRQAQGDATQWWRLKAVRDEKDTFTIQQESNSRYMDAHLRGRHGVVTRPNQLDDTQRWKLISLTSSELSLAQEVVRRR